jgi:predicted permease
MVQVLTQMGALIFCGAAWRIIRPGGLDADLARAALATLVFNLMLPALVLQVLWTCDLGLESLRISALGAALVLFGAALAWLATRFLRLSPQRRGAAILAVAFANVTYMGLPVLEQTFGPWARAIAIQIDLFASMPLVLTFGVLLSRHYGAAADGDGMARSLLVNPPLWAALAAVALNLGGAAVPGWAERLLGSLSAPVVPLMLLALGLGLRWDSWNWRSLPLAALVLGCKLVLAPAFGLWLAMELGFRGDRLSALALEAGMPSMVLGVVFCDRYRLDTAFYAMAVTLTTLGAMLTLPFWRAASLLPAY